MDQIVPSITQFQVQQTVYVYMTDDVLNHVLKETPSGEHYSILYHSWYNVQEDGVDLEVQGDSSL